MRKITKYAGTLFMLSVGCASAAQSSGPFIEGGWADAPLFSQSHLTLNARNYWKYLKEDESQPKEVHNAWGQAITLDYRSGYLFDTIGFDASYTGVIKLAASDYFSTRALLYNDGTGFEKGNAKGYNKMGQRYLKLKLGDESLGLNAKAGWQVLKNYGVLTASHRLTQNSYAGYSARLHADNLFVDAAWVTSGINRDSPNKTAFLTADKQRISSISTLGATWKDPTLLLSLNYGEAENYLARQVIEMAWRPEKKLTLGSQIYGTQALGKYDSMSASRKAFDDSAWHYAADVKWQEPDWSIKFGLGWTDAQKNSGLGYYDRHIAKNMRGRFNAMTSAGVDYMRDGELALTTLGEYQFVKGITTGLQLNYGQFNFSNNTIRTGEVSLINHWAPAEGKFKNLSVFSMFGYGWSYKQDNKTPRLNSEGHYQRSPNLSGEIIIDYKFNLL